MKQFEVNDRGVKAINQCEMVFGTKDSGETLGHMITLARVLIDLSTKNGDGETVVNVVTPDGCVREIQISG